MPTRRRTLSRRRRRGGGRGKRLGTVRRRGGGDDSSQPRKTAKFCNTCGCVESLHIKKNYMFKTNVKYCPDVKQPGHLRTQTCNFGKSAEYAEYTEKESL
jgi:hypothetical protein